MMTSCAIKDDQTSVSGRKDHGLMANPLCVAVRDTDAGAENPFLGLPFGGSKLDNLGL